MRIRLLAAAVSICILLTGCGRKLPPLPPALPDPVEVISIRFEGPLVQARVRCNISYATVQLLGKPKGLCPECTDDLEVKDKISIEKPGEFILKDEAPRSDYMVYRITEEHERTRWMTPAQIVVKK